MKKGKGEGMSAAMSDQELAQLRGAALRMAEYTHAKDSDIAPLLKIKADLAEKRKVQEQVMRKIQEETAINMRTLTMALMKYIPEELRV